MAFPKTTGTANERPGTEVTPSFERVKKAFGGSKKAKHGPSAAAFLKGLGR